MIKTYGVKESMYIVTLSTLSTFLGCLEDESDATQRRLRDGYLEALMFENILV